MTELAGIRFAQGREPPKGTLLNISVSSLSDHARVRLKLPGQQSWKDFGDIPIVDRTLELPVKFVFLIHAKEDQDKVGKVAARLHEDSFLTWFAPKSLIGGDAWKERIDEAIEGSDFVLVFLSKASSGKTGYFQREVKYAFEQRELRPDGERYIIPVLLEDFTPPRRFSEIHWVSYWEPDGYEKLNQSLE